MVKIQGGKMETLLLQRQRDNGKLLGDAYRLSRAKKAELLSRILEGDVREAATRWAPSVLTNNLLAELIKKSTGRGLPELYRFNPLIKRLLVKTLEEFSRQRKSFSPGMFVGEQGRLNCVILTRHVLEEKLGMTFAEVMQRASFRLLYAHHLRCAKVCFRHLADLIMACYPEKELKPYYFRNYRGMWLLGGKFNEELAGQALREFVDLLVWGDRKHKRKIGSMPQWLTFRMFQRRILPYDRSLSYLLNLRFKNSHIRAAMFAYPDMGFQPHYFKHVPRGYWKGPEGRKRAQVIVREFVQILSDPKGKYRFTRPEALNLLKFTTMQKPVLPYRKRLGGMLRVVYGNSAPRVREEMAESV
ncbi:hypothetical protein J4439_00690 [Candidatus Woesearchaeota archaeon]|nr:hypothetical protein [Candidatus Woesearchaeota archaeon]